MNTREYFADKAEDTGDFIDCECVEWARKHDWFEGFTIGKRTPTTPHGYTISGLCDATGHTFVFTNMTDLLDWSGY